MHCLLISPLKASEISVITLSIQRCSGPVVFQYVESLHNHKPRHTTH